MPQTKIDHDWLQLLTEFAADWNRTISAVHPRFSAQGYWHLFLEAAKAHCAGKPFTLSQALRALPSGSNKTREDKVELAVRAGLLEKRQDPNDKRKVLVLPSERLEALLIEHLNRTRALANAALTRKILADS